MNHVNTKNTLCAQAKFVLVDLWAEYMQICDFMQLLDIIDRYASLVQCCNFAILAVTSWVLGPEVMASGVNGTISDAVQRALQKAAARAERHAVLDTARPTLERVLNYPHPPELLPWGAAMSTSYLFSYSTWYRSTSVLESLVDGVQKCAMCNI